MLTNHRQQISSLLAVKMNLSGTRYQENQTRFCLENDKLSTMPGDLLPLPVL